MRDFDLLIAACDDLLQRDNNFNPNVLSLDLPLASPVEKAVKQPSSETTQIKSETAAPEYFIKINAAEKIFVGKSGDTGKTPVVIFFALLRVG